MWSRMCPHLERFTRNRSGFCLPPRARAGRPLAQEGSMQLRATACGTAALILGLLAIGPAAAQPYPPYGGPYGPPPPYGPFGPYGPPPVYGMPRHAPPYSLPPELADDELPPGEIPGGASSSVAVPYPVSPPQPSPYTGSIPQQAAPSGGSAPLAAPVHRSVYGAAPGTAYPQDPGSAPPGSPATGDPRYAAPDAVPRPPVEVDPARRQAIAALPPE